MKKKIIIATMLAALAAVPVFAAATDQAQPQNEMFNKHQIMVQKAVESGTMTAEQAAQMNEHMQQMAPVMEKMMKSGGMMNGNMMQNDCVGNVNNNK